MGTFFSNLHIRKSDGVSPEAVRSFLDEALKKQGFLPVNDTDEIDLSISVYDAGGKWLSVCSDGIDFYTDESLRDFCGPLSERFSADVLTISCFDSDCLLMNLINRQRGTDAWAKIGHDPSVKRRSTPARWKDAVSDLPLWKALLKEDHACAEDSLEDIEPLLGLEPEQGWICSDLITEPEYEEHAKTFCYALPDALRNADPPQLKILIYDLMPCKMGIPKIILAGNTGGKAKGLAIAFSGKYVEKDEIWFHDVQLEYKSDRNPRSILPLDLEKRQTPDGQWIYYAEAPQFVIQSVRKGLSGLKQMDEEFNRGFGVRFTPEGNERKRLDITLHFIPLKNVAGQCGWCAWWPYRNKEAFIEDHNRTWSKYPAYRESLLDINMLDLDE